jgi:hypothetical protein
MLKTTMSADDVFDRHFLEIRGKLLEIAADLDRVDRADGGRSKPTLARIAQIASALDVLSEGLGDSNFGRATDRAERIQLLFSRPYDSNWVAEIDAMKRSFAHRTTSADDRTRADR